MQKLCTVLFTVIVLVHFVSPAPADELAEDIDAAIQQASSELSVYMDCSWAEFSSNKDDAYALDFVEGDFAVVAHGFVAYSGAEGAFRISVIVDNPKQVFIPEAGEYLGGSHTGELLSDREFGIYYQPEAKTNLSVIPAEARFGYGDANNPGSAVSLVFGVAFERQSVISLWFFPQQTCFRYFVPDWSPGDEIDVKVEPQDQGVVALVYKFPTTPVVKKVYFDTTGRIPFVIKKLQEVTNPDGSLLVQSETVESWIEHDGFRIPAKIRQVTGPLNSPDEFLVRLFECTDRSSVRKATSNDFQLSVPEGMKFNGVSVDRLRNEKGFVDLDKLHKATPGVVAGAADMVKDDENSLDDGFRESSKTETDPGRGMTTNPFVYWSLIIGLLFLVAGLWHRFRKSKS